VIFSRFCHQYQHEGKTVFFHSLNFNLAIFPDEEAALIKSDNADLIRELREKQMIIHSEDEDIQLLEQAKQKIRKPYISTAYFFITNDCNLACTYCFEKQSEPGWFKKEAMTEEVALQGLRFFSNLAKHQPERFHEKKTIIFYGGEPLKNKAVLRYTIGRINDFMAQGELPSGTRIIVVTNGTLINDDDIVFFKKHRVTLTFSIDGDELATENRAFPDGRPAFAKITAAYKKCRDAGLDLNVACTLTPVTLERMQESLRFLIDELRINNIGFNVLLDNGLMAIPEGYDDAAADFVAEAGKILAAHHISENRNVRRRQVFERRQPCIFDCNAQGGRQIAIAPGGEVGICHEHISDRQHFVTTVFDDFSPENDPVYLEWNRRTPLNMPKCLDCPALGICGGGCVINTERSTGGIWEPDPRFCKQTLKLLEMILLEKVVVSL
jgi:uncharacterized protein